MSDRILFEITEQNLETGMRGYPVGYCTTSFVDPENGLFYRGRPILEFRSWDPEAAIFFLQTGREPKGSAYEEFVRTLQSNGALKKATVEHIEKLPREGHPMKLLSSALLILGMIEGRNDYAKDCELLIAKMPHLVATVINHHAGWGATPPAEPQRGYMEHFARMIQAPDKDLPQLTEAFRLFNILHYDHGGGNLSAFVGKSVASGLEDMFGSVASSMCALAGPRHGRANQDCLNFVQSALDKVGEEASEDDVEAFLRSTLEKGGLAYGFGHAVLRNEDARASILYDYVEENFPNHPLVRIATLLRSVGPKVLKENPKIADPYPNVDAISGTALAASGFVYPEYFTLLFGMSRIVGIATQIVYERIEARGGKGTPIVRPRYIYKAQT